MPDGQLDRGIATEHDQVRQGHFLIARLAAIETRLDLFQDSQDFVQLFRLVDCPVSLRLQTNPGTVSTTALIRSTEGRS